MKVGDPSVVDWVTANSPSFVGDLSVIDSITVEILTSSISASIFTDNSPSSVVYLSVAD